MKLIFLSPPYESGVQANCDLICCWIPQQVWVFSIYSFGFQLKALWVAALKKRWDGVALYRELRLGSVNGLI